MPTISWRKAGQLISQSAKFSFGAYKKRLTVNNPATSDEGIYECRVTNSFNEQKTKSANLTIIGNHQKIHYDFICLLYVTIINTGFCYNEVLFHTFTVTLTGVKEIICSIRDFAVKARLHRRFLSRNSMQFLSR